MYRCHFHLRLFWQQRLWELLIGAALEGKTVAGASSQTIPNLMKIVVEESVLAFPEVKGILSTRGGIFAKAFARPNLVFELKH
jgi:hypothetical protein